MLRKNKYGMILLNKPDAGSGGSDDPLAEQAHERGDGEHQEPEPAKSAEYEKRKEAFLSKFTARNNGPAGAGGDASNAPNQDEIKQREADAVRQAREDTERREHSQSVKKKAGSNVPQILEGKREAEKKAADLEARVKEYEETKEPAYKKQIADLEAKINTGELTSAKESEYQERITSIETKMKADMDSLVNENARIKERLSVHDLSENEQFQAEYIKPIGDAHAEAVAILNGDEKQVNVLHRACMANAAALRSTDPAQKRAAEQERDTLMTQLLDSVQPFTGQRLTSVFNTFINKTAAHAKALQEHAKTSEQIVGKQKEAQQRNYAKTLETWGSTFKAKAGTFDSEDGLTDDEIKSAEELGLKTSSEIKEADLIASKVIVGQSGMESAVEMIHRGRVYPKLKAKIALRDKQLADAEALIKKLRGAGTSGGSSDGGPNPTPKKETKTREQFHKQFSASRAELQRR